MEQSSGSLPAVFPGATGLFDAHQLDFCCAGNRSLRTATESLGIDPQPLVDALKNLEQRAATEPEQDWSDASDTQLVEHLLVRYHAVHREQLPELISAGTSRGACTRLTAKTARMAWPTIWKPWRKSWTATCAKKRWCCSP